MADSYDNLSKEDVVVLLRKTQESLRVAREREQAALRLAERTVFDATVLLSEAGKWWVDDGGCCMAKLLELQERLLGARLASSIETRHGDVYCVQAGPTDRGQGCHQAGAPAHEVVHTSGRGSDSDPLHTRAATGNSDPDRLGDDVICDAWAVARADPNMQILCARVVQFHIRVGLLLAG
jgi:hypothetical protein